MSNEMLCLPGVSKLISLIPNQHTRTTIPQIQSQLCHQVEHYLEKNTPLYYVGKVEGSGGSLLSHQSCKLHHITGMTRGTTK